MENINLCYFCSCGSLRKARSVSTLFPGVRAVEMIDSVDDIRDFRSHATNVRIFETPLPIEVSDPPGKLQLELMNCSVTQFRGVVSTRKRLELH
jgi:hypothetical protein